MALNKAKVLKAAEKYVIQGKISHAISEYQKLIKEDPTDLPLVNTLGDLHVRIGNISEAVKCFTRLAESYDNGGFVVRAIAMYKKVCKIDPAQIRALTRLADLYVRQGLMSDARAHYMQAAETLLRKGSLKEASEAFGRIVEVDPENPAIEARVAEVREKLGEAAEAALAYHAAAQKSKKKGSLEEAESYLKKAAELNQSDVKVALAFAEVLSELGKTEEALSRLEKFQFQEFNPEILEGRFRICLKAGRFEEALKSALHLTELDNQYFRLHLTLAEAYATKGDFDSAVAEIARISTVALEKGEGQEVEKHLKSILHQSPDHIPTLLEFIRYCKDANVPHNLPSLLEKVGELFARNEQYAEAASIYNELAHLEPSNPVHRETLLQIKAKMGSRGDEIELPRLVPDMSSIAEKFVSEPTLRTITPSGNGESATTTQDDLEAGSQEQIKGYFVEGDLFASYGLYQKAIEQYRKVLDFVPSHVEIHERIRDMYAKAGEHRQAAQQCLVLASIYSGRGDSDSASRNFALAYQYDPNLHQEPIYPEPRQPEVSSPLEAPATPDQTDPLLEKRLKGLLEEIDFYFEQSFLLEAKACIDEYLRLNPGGPEGLRLLEIYHERLSQQEKPAPQSEAEIPAEGAKPPTEVAEEIQINEFEPTTLPTPKPDLTVDSASGLATDSQVSLPPESSSSESTVTAEVPQASEAFHEMMIDLDSELKGSGLEEPVHPVAVPGSSPGVVPFGEGSGLEDVFAEFKEGLEDEEKEDVDYETHYSLGIAFKEMGLIEEAIGEFQKALKGCSPVENGEEFVRCCNMLGLCFLEKGLPQVAIKWFTKGLQSPGRDEETYQALRYDLGCAHELAGNRRAALETFLDVYGVNINYRDVAEKIETLKKSING